VKFIKFNEIQTEELNCGWCMTAGVVVGVGVTVGGALLIVT
jgi:hypothetical protein